MEAVTQRVRVRFAPSPTGPFHMGSLRTTLFNYLFARRSGGDFVLRVEDTDKERSEKRWEQDMMANLEWLGLQWDEGPTPDGKDKGPHAPYRQSKRTETYAPYLRRLLTEEKAYYCFCSEEELEAQKQAQASSGETPRYPGTCRNLSKAEQERRIAEGKPAVIRFRTPHKVVAFDDIIRGQVKFDASLLGDFIIAKSLDAPLYNFTVVIDDQLMEISHVIRGEDHIANTPKQILLQEALGFRPVLYAHLPLLLGEDRAKLSKRHGDNSATRFREEGYLPEAVVNFLALLGWNPGNDREIFTIQDLAKEFSLERVQKGGAVFNLKRLDWLNGYYIRQKSARELAELCVPYLINAGFIVRKDGLFADNANPAFIVTETGEGIGLEHIEQIATLYQERMKKISEITEFADFFFKKTLKLTKHILRWKDAPDEKVLRSLDDLLGALSDILEEQWTKEHLSSLLLKKAEAYENRGVLLWPLRVALTGKEASAGPFEVAAALGKEKTLRRVQEAKALYL